MRQEGNDSLGSDHSALISTGVSTVGAVTENSPGLPVHQRASELLALVWLAWRQHQVHGFVVGSSNQVDFGREATARVPEAWM